MRSDVPDPKLPVTAVKVSPSVNYKAGIRGLRHKGSATKQKQQSTYAHTGLFFAEVVAAAEIFLEPHI